LTGSVVIVGQDTVQNAVMADMISRTSGLPCTVKTGLAGIPEAAPQELLVLFDWIGCVGPACLPERGAEIQEIAKRYPAALFNVTDAEVSEEKAIQWGLRGIFYPDATMHMFNGGLAALLRGELWFSRRTMSKVVMKKLVPRSATPAPRLTSREKEILEKVASGFSNAEIAGLLNISASTVKSHLYSIFEKIEAQNRVQAALWATKNL
jgi:LuxR family transcriptional regulator of csgAB operon